MNSRAFDSAASANGAVHLPEWTLGRRPPTSQGARIVHALFMPPGSVLNSWASMIVLARGSDLYRPVLCLAPYCSSSGLINHQPCLFSRGNCVLPTPRPFKTRLGSVEIQNVSHLLPACSPGLTTGFLRIEYRRRSPDVIDWRLAEEVAVVSAGWVGSHGPDRADSDNRGRHLWEASSARRANPSGRSGDGAWLGQASQGSSPHFSQN